MLGVIYYLFDARCRKVVKYAKNKTVKRCFLTNYGFIKYSRWESNPHSRKNWILNPARLPIPPLELISDSKNIYFFDITHKNTS